MPTEDTKALAQAPIGLLNDPAQREHWREAGARRVLNFALGRLVLAWQAVLRETATGCAPGLRRGVADLVRR